LKELLKLNSGYVNQYRNIVLDALSNSPESFAFAYSDVNTKPMDFWLKKLENVYGCLIDDELVSIISLKQDTGYSTHCGDIYFICVTPRLQGKGYGKFMLKSIEQIAAEKGIEKLFLTLVHTNPAFDLYKNIGYVVTGYEQDIRRVSGVKYDRYCMQKNLL
jgi:[ribosomal protein S18]-alanine N-acetyltransferase